MKRFLNWVAAAVCVVFFAALGAAEVWTAERVRTVDENGDGRPDVWRHFDPRGQLTEIDVDTNFDGQPDVAEYYERGVLVRRESDRNFNGQADLIEEFDAVTHGQTRAVIDVDFDGSADLLVLFRNGRPVFATRARRERPATTGVRAVRAGDSAGLVPLVNPFDSDAAVRANHVSVDGADRVALAAFGGPPSFHFVLVDRLPTSGAIGIADSSCPSSAAHRTRSSRAPPAV